MTERELTERELTERVAAGLRCLKKPPDYLLFCDSQQREEDLEPPKMVCGILVVYSAFVDTGFDCSMPMFFCPVWTTPGCYIVERRAFENGYEEWGED